MSHCKMFGKDKVMFVTKEEHAIPSTVELPPPEPAQTLITNDGEINWGCPCLGGMATGPCGVQFRDAFSCFHYSTADPKGSDCYDAFRTMQDCFGEYPTVYNKTGVEDHDVNREGELVDPGETVNDVTLLGSMNLDKSSSESTDNSGSTSETYVPKEVIDDRKELAKV